MCRVMCRVMWLVMCQVVTAPLTMGTYQGPWPQGTLGGPWPSGTHGHSFPLAHGHSFLVANTLHQPWPMAAFVSRRPLAPWRPRPLAASNLRRPLAHRAPLATIGYQGVVVIRNGRVIEPIERGGGHGRRGGHSGLGGMSWWCGGMSWKWCGRTGGSWGVVRSRCHGLTYPPREGTARGIAPSTSARGPRALLPRISVSDMAAWRYLARGVSALMPLAGYDRVTDARGSGRGRNIGYRLCTLVVP